MCICMLAHKLLQMTLYILEYSPVLNISINYGSIYCIIISFRARKERMNPGDNPPQCRAQKCTTLRSRPTLNSGLSTQALMCSVHMCHILFVYQEWQWVSHVFLFSYLSNKLVYGLTGQIVPWPIENQGVKLLWAPCGHTQLVPTVHPQLLTVGLHMHVFWKV